MDLKCVAGMSTRWRLKGAAGQAVKRVEIGLIGFHREEMRGHVGIRVARSRRRLGLDILVVRDSVEDTVDAISEERAMGRDKVFDRPQSLNEGGPLEEHVRADCWEGEEACPREVLRKCLVAATEIDRARAEKDNGSLGHVEVESIPAEGHHDVPDDGDRAEHKDGRNSCALTIVED
jgi:hypothetical protein